MNTKQSLFIVRAVFNSMLIVVLVFGQVGQVFATAAIVYVKSDAGEAHNGTSWSNVDSNQYLKPAGSPSSGMISAGGNHTCAITTAGGAMCWGYNTYGQLGDGTATLRKIPTDVSGLTSDVSAIAAGAYHTCALTTSGGVECWGYNGDGELGDGTMIYHNIPTAVNGLTSGIAAIDAGSKHTCALTMNGGVKCWGYNGYGQLGDDTTTQRNTPTDVSGLASGVTAIATGTYHTCALMTSGGVQCWGDNGYGQLGDDTMTQRNIPTDVSGLTSDVIAIAAGDRHTCALTTSGGVLCWGDNAFEQIGDGTSTQRNTPVGVSGLTENVTAISAGGNHNCALLTTGGVQCWGYNYFGQLGNGTTTQSNTPVGVSGLASGVAAISAGAFHTCAFTASSVVKCWGNNELGQLGDNTTTSSAIPVDVIGLTSVPTDIALSASNLAENQPSGTGIGLLTTSDADTADTFTYSLVNGGTSCPGTDNASFQIGTGSLSDQLQSAEVFDYETKSSYTICIRTTDDSGNTFDKEFNVSITDVLEDTFTVNTIADTDDSSCNFLGQGIGNQDCSLREAINAANATSGANTIDFDDALGTATITLTTTLPTIADTDGLTIDGSGDITLSGNNITQVFIVSTSVPLTLDSLTVSNGYAIGHGGGINNAGTLTLNSSVVSANTATGQGGGIFNQGTLTLNYSTVNGNSAAHGGGISNNCGTLMLNNSTVSGNSATSGGFGGGIFNCGTLTMSNGMVSSNSANTGGGLVTQGGSASINNSTIGGAGAGNTSTGAGGGGIYADNGGNLTLTNTTVSHNTATPGGAGGGIEWLSTGTLTIQSNSVISSNSANTGGGLYLNAGTVNITSSTIGGVDAGNSSTGGGGGGIRVNGGNLTLTTTTVSHNTATPNVGGGIEWLSAGILTIQTSSVISSNSAIVGGGLYMSTGTVNITSSLIGGAGAGNTSTGAGGGGFYVDGGTLTLTNSAVNSNTAGGSGSGGGIFNIAMMTLNNSTVSDNHGANHGAIYNSGTLKLNNSTVSNNTSNLHSGGIFNGGALTLNNSTVSGNAARDTGGGIFNGGGTLTLNYSTVANNTSDSDNNGGNGGGIFNQGTVDLTSSIVAGNKKGTTGITDATADCGGGAITSQSYNLTGSGTGCNLSGTGDVTVAPADVFTTVLGALASNGGATQTHALLTGSPAINQIPSGSNGCGSPPFEIDQRGQTRPKAEHCDIGAYEYEFFFPVLYVETGGLTNGLCNSWLNACELRYALSIAVPEQEIWVAAGIYSPVSGTDRTATFTLENGVAIYGGFAGTETLLSQRDPVTNITTLSGDLNGDDGPNFANNGDNSYHVLTTGSGINSTAILDGFTITAGNANGTFPNDAGAGIFNNGGSPMLTDVTFSENKADYGGGMYNNSGNLTLTDVTFNGNSATNYYGGGIYNDNGSNLTLMNVTLSGNTASFGGGISNFGLLTVTNSTLSGNSATSAGGIYNLGTLTVTNSTLSGNSSNVNGGGISNGGTLTVTNSTFSSNSAGAGGGGIINGGTLTVTNSTFSGNSAVNGGGIFSTSTLTVTNSTLSDNSAVAGGGIYTYTGNSTLNYANTVIANSTSGGDCINDGGATIGTNTNNLVEDGSCSAEFSVDPVLGALADNGGFTQTMALNTSSPAIDAGNDATCGATDQRGVSRVGTCDIGAYEYEYGFYLILYAQPGGLTSGLCNSWLNACELRYALYRAVSGQEIWAKAGMYKPTGGTDRTATFTLKNGVAVYGGFITGTETLLTERDPVDNITTLSGDIGTVSDISDNSYHVVTGGGTNNTAILDGFTITAGNANGGSSPNDRGGGMLNLNSSNPSLTNVTFNGNSAVIGGGGMFIFNSSNLSLTNVTFSNNSASSATSIGGGMYSQNSNLTLTNVTFSGNSAENGGGVRNEAGVLVVTNSTFFGNSASFNGGGISNNGTLTVTNSTFSGNSANNVGGGIRTVIEGTTTLRNTIVADSLSGGDCSNNGTIIDGGNNIVEDNTCGFSSGNDPNLGPLQDNGGFTQTMALGADSPAIDAGNNAACPATDQRGVTRHQDGDNDGTASCDIGAYEYEFVNFSPAITESDPQTVVMSIDGSPTAFALTLHATDVNSNDTLTWSISNPATHGTATAIGTGLSKAIGYSPTMGYIGTDSFEVQVSDGTFTDTITVNVIIRDKIYVKWDASGTNNGTTWANAYTDLNTALASALSGDEIWVAAGVYTPTSGTDRTATFTLKNGVAIYGGFAGTETLLSQRDPNPATNNTTLSGDIGILSDASDNSYHVLTGGGTNNTAILDGFTVTAGNANGGAAYNNGGGMYNVDNSSPGLTNVTFSSNIATAHGGGIYNQSSSPSLTNITFSNNTALIGGGMFNKINSSPALTNVTFNANTALLGGGMYNELDSSPSVTNVTFNNNTASDRGGGMYNTFSSPSLTNVTFNANMAGSAGGMFNNSSSSSLTNVTFSGNTANVFGGGMYNANSSSPTLTDVTFSNNTASGSGGGMLNLNSSPTMTNVTFSSNTASIHGGGVYNYSGSLVLTNVTFSGNSAANGGGISNTGTLTVTNGTFSGNSASEGSGGGVWNFGTLDLTNTIIANSTSGGDCQNGGTIGTNINNIVEDNSCGFSGGNDPNLGALADNGGFTQTMALGVGSPAIDAGDNAACPATDQRGVARPQDGNGDGSSVCDIGAFEAPSIPSLSIADVNILEGNTGTTQAVFTVSLANPDAQTVTIDFATVDGTAITGSDYTATSGTLTFNPGDITQTISVDVIGDTLVASNQTFLVDLSNPVNAVIADGQAVGTILDDDTPSLSGPVYPPPAGVTFARTGDIARAGGVEFTYTNLDFSQFSTLFWGPARADAVGIAFDNTLDAPGEFLAYTPAQSDLPNGVEVWTGSANITIMDPGPSTLTLPTRFTLRTLDLAGNPISLADGAGAGIPDTGAVVPVTSSFKARMIMEAYYGGTWIPVKDLFDSLHTQDGVQSRTSFEGGFFYITPYLTVTLDDVSVAEGDSGTTNAVFTLSLSTVSDQPVSVNFSTADDTATSGSDYAATSGSLTFNENETTKTVNVQIDGDTLYEADETFFLNLSNPTNVTIIDGQGVGTIQNDDAAPTVSIDNVALAEGDSGTTDAVFTVSLSATSDLSVTVDFATADSTATAGSDYTSVNGSLTFDPGEVTKTITIPVQGDNLNEADETFTVSLANATNAAIATATGTGTIQNDDNPPVITEGDVISVTMSEDGLPTAFDLTLNATDADGDTLTWSISTPAGNGTATAFDTGLSKAIGYTPLTGYSGTDSFDVQVSDGNGGTDVITVNVTIEPVNDAPVITEGASVTVTMSEDGSPTAFDLTLNATDPDGDTLTWSIRTPAGNGTATASDTGLSKVIGYSPSADYNGSDSFDVQVTDGNGGSDTITVNVTIEAVNDAPSYTAANPPTILEDAGTQTITGWATFSPGPANESGQTVDSYTVGGVSNPGLFSLQPAVAADGTLSYRPATNANGTSTFTVRVGDSGGTAFGGINFSASQTFTITVTAVNDYPTYTKGPDQTVNEDAGPQSVPGWATNISAGPPDESGQTVGITVFDNSNPALFAVMPVIDAISGDLTYTPAANANGSASLKAAIADSGGSANGGIPLGPYHTFVITVTVVNDAPVITEGAAVNVTMSQNGSPTAFDLTLNATDIDNSAAALNWSISTPASNGTAVASGTGASQVIGYTPTPGYSGTDSFDVRLDDGNLSDFITVNVTIRPMLTVSANLPTMPYGDAEPSFTPAYSGFVGGDNSAVLDTQPTCGVAGPHTDAGVYTIICSGGVDDTYDFTYVDGTLTITKVTLTVTALDKSINYGESDPGFTIQYSGFVAGDSFADLDTQPTCGVAGAHTDAGTYTITCSGGADNNYDFTYVNGTLTIAQVMLTVTADDPSIVYGGAEPTFTLQYSGFVGSDTFADLDTQPTCGVAGAHTDAGTYTITCSGGADNNYSFSYVDGTLTVAKATLTITAHNKDIVFGDLEPSFTFTYSGFESGDAFAVLDTQPTCGVAVAHTDAGTYTITCSGGVDNNYGFTYVDGTLTIAKADQTIINVTAPATAVTGEVFGVSATVDPSGLPVSFSASSSCTNTGATFTMTDGSSTCTVTYDQPGDSNFNPAPQVTRTVFGADAPILLTPADGELLLNNTPTFDWTDVPAAISYTIEISNDIAFGSTITSLNVPVSSYNPSTDLPSGVTLYWRVCNETATGPGLCSVSSSFATAAPPSVPNLNAPINDVVTAGLRPLFDWSTSTLAPGTSFLKYELQISTDNLFTSPTSVDVTRRTNPDYTPATDLNPDTQYYWRVRAFNTLGQFSSWSVVGIFRTPFGTPVLLSPTNNSSTFNTQPVFDWSDVPGATSYTIEIATNSSFSLTSIVITANVTDSTFTPASPLSQGWRHWRVQAIGPNGPGPWSLTFRVRLR